MEGVIVLNSSYEVLGSVDWQRAVCLVVTGEAEVYESDPVRVVRSQHLTLPLPRIVLLHRYVYVAYSARPEADAAGAATRKGVLLRDRYVCIYCGNHGSTIDHLQPASRGGGNTWDNLAACCHSCNNIKADRTPEEAGMRPRWIPWRPDLVGAAQRRVWAGIAAANEVAIAG